MANWCNARLIAFGRKAAVMSFSDAVRSRPAATFRDDMLVGEAQELSAERMQRRGKNLYRKVFVFQVRNGDGLNEFRQVSKRHRTLSFVLVFGDPNFGDFGSYLLKRGSVRSFRLSQRKIEAVMRKHGVSEEDDDDEEWRYWEASWEAMDIAESKWATLVERPNFNSRQKELEGRNGPRAAPRFEAAAKAGARKRHSMSVGQKAAGKRAAAKK